MDRNAGRFQGFSFFEGWLRNRNMCRKVFSCVAIAKIKVAFSISSSCLLGGEEPFPCGLERLNCLYLGLEGRGRGVRTAIETSRTGQYHIIITSGLWFDSFDIACNYFCLIEV